MFPSTQICAMILLYLTAPVSCEESVSEVPRMTLWDIIMSLMQSQSLAKTMPSVSSFPSLRLGAFRNSGAFPLKNRKFSNPEEALLLRDVSFRPLTFPSRCVLTRGSICGSSATEGYVTQISDLLFTIHSPTVSNVSTESSGRCSHKCSRTDD